MSYQDRENKGTLQSRIHSTVENLPELEARGQNLRGELYMEREKKLRPYIGESLTVGAEPYQLRDMKMVQDILDEVVEELMDDYLRHVPLGIQPGYEKDKRTKINQETSLERGVQLTMEQLGLEVTTEMAKHLGQEIFTQKNPSWALSFDVILSATKEERNTKERREKKNDDDQIYFVLQHIKVQDHYSKKEVWKCMLEEHVEDESMKRGGYVDDGFNILGSF
ncbi:uncharacterized protein LOC102382794 isoform X1 [Alligator sinensis]|uniref:Uncharacterized protein LOC102382794 isoform X1 n=1 Tax=Alligator sinensis TaxID=38654 RepID=A0A3Q0G7N3_ALLSI|nr:uncharacterized protein LOC102382794 isoform X1 [Alligator sinensis]